MNANLIERLRLVANGLTAEEIAIKQSVSVQAVNASLLKARRKLGAKTTTEAVYRACKIGLIAITFIASPIVHSFIFNKISEGYVSNSFVCSFEYRRAREQRRNNRKRRETIV